ncbi:DUF1801 domain-containing protein [Micromonospora sp. CA-259024]|uniref:DUF1801 domain-containing protein n=1 Tax=Micromonospora sp. CA-259024 TaxID=3239965 RepID=UPI003D9108B9
MATAKQPVTVPTAISVDDFLASNPDERRRADAGRLRAIMGELTGEPAVMWGPSIVGFGSYHYTYASGRTGDAPLVGFSPRKQHLVVYLVRDVTEILMALCVRLFGSRAAANRARRAVEAVTESSPV